jgi:LysR family transcriptional regulator, transcription activator of glutamate synthase operon
VTEKSDLDRVTQSGVSRALARLEAEVGTALLRRSGRTLRMTRAGAAFKGHVDALLHDELFRKHVLKRTAETSRIGVRTG